LQLVENELGGDYLLHGGNQCHMRGYTDKLVANWWQTGSKLVANWWQTGGKLVANWWQTGDKLVAN
jgi:hypothetical protein